MLLCLMSPPTQSLPPPASLFLEHPTPPPWLTPTYRSGAWWAENSSIWGIQIRGFPGCHSICFYLCSWSSRGRRGAPSPSLSDFSAFLLVIELTSWWRVLAHPSSLSIPVSDAVIQAAGRELCNRHSHSLHGWRKRVGVRTRGHQCYLYPLPMFIILWAFFSWA